MARDIEEFLKRAAERRRQQQRPAQPPPRRQPPRPAPEPPLVISDVEVLPDPYQEGVAEHVKKHISTDEIAQHAGSLGGDVAQRDDRIDERIHQKFDHDVGHLNLDDMPSVQDQTTQVTDTQISHVAFGLIEMLRNPKTLRQAVIISEILKRPEL